MANIQISGLALFESSESFLEELTDREVGTVVGGGINAIGGQFFNNIEDNYIGDYNEITQEITFDNIQF